MVYSSAVTSTRIPSDAAVSVVVRANRHLDLLLIKRARSERDPWSGHMALPGGRRDPEDRDLEATASRETLEETGLDLAGVGTPLGRLDLLTPGPDDVFGTPDEA